MFWNQTDLTTARLKKEKKKKTHSKSCRVVHSQDPDPFAQCMRWILDWRAPFHVSSMPWGWAELEVRNVVNHRRYIKTSSSSPECRRFYLRITPQCFLIFFCVALRTQRHFLFLFFFLLISIIYFVCLGAQITQTRLPEIPHRSTFLSLIWMENNRFWMRAMIVFL